MLRNILIVILALIFGYVYKELNTDESPLYLILSKSEKLRASFDRKDEVSDLSKIKLASNMYFTPKLDSGFKDREQIGIENATIVMLTRNFEIEGVLSSMRSLEDRFNHKYKYPWTFLNDVPFTDDFKERTTLMASSHTSYGLISPEVWDRPKWINDTLMEENMAQMDEDGVLYATSKSYRNMCRFNSGYFYKEPLMMDYDYYFRVEPDVEYMCDFTYDPFSMMRINDKNYGFVMTFYEYENTIPTLWPTVENFMAEYPQYVHPNSSIGFITNKEIIGNKPIPVHSTSDYNMCHFWSNFEIGNLNFFRSELYESFFKYLEKTGGFYYERWGDAPVHSIGVSLLMDKSKIHHFDDIGYYHAPFMTCPTSSKVKSNNRCICKEDTHIMDNKDHSCLAKWWKFGGGKKFMSEL